jgi:hypothetical protein
MLDAIESFRQKFLKVAPYFRPLIFVVIAVVVFVNRSRRGGSGSRAFQLRRRDSISSWLGSRPKQRSAIAKL